MFTVWQFPVSSSYKTLADKYEESSLAAIVHTEIPFCRLGIQYPFLSTFHSYTSLYRSLRSENPIVLHFCFTSTMEAPGTTTGLLSIAENTYFVLGAYFFAFFPWVVMQNIGFISEKWRTVRKTRAFPYVHMILSVVPCLYFAVYAEAQRQNKDSKEQSAVMAALMFKLISFCKH